MDWTGARCRVPQHEKSRIDAIEKCDETGSTTGLAGPAGSSRHDYHIIQLTRSRSYRHRRKHTQTEAKLRLLQYATLSRFGLV